MNLASGWLAHYNLCWSGFRHLTYQIRLRFLRPCKILRAAVISSCVILMCPACSPTFPLTKLSKFVQKLSITNLISNHYSDLLYDDFDLQPLIPKDVFVELMKSATFSFEFSFNNTMYKQTDGVAMGSPLGPALTNIFARYYEESYFLKRKSLQHTSDTLMTR